MSLSSAALWGRTINGGRCARMCVGTTQMAGMGEGFTRLAAWAVHDIIDIISIACVGTAAMPATNGCATGVWETPPERTRGATAHQPRPAPHTQLLWGHSASCEAAPPTRCVSIQASSSCLACASGTCFGGVFLKYALASISAPLILWSDPSLQQRTASVTAGSAPPTVVPCKAVLSRWPVDGSRPPQPPTFWASNADGGEVAPSTAARRRPNATCPAGLPPSAWATEPPLGGSRTTSGGGRLHVLDTALRNTHYI